LWMITSPEETTHFWDTRTNMNDDVLSIARHIKVAGYLHIGNLAMVHLKSCNSVMLTAICLNFFMWVGGYML
jgi:hypothetical protein